MVAITLAAVAIGWVASNLAERAESEAILMRKHRPSVTHLTMNSRRDSSKLPWMWRILGAEPVDVLGYDPQQLRPEEIERLQLLFSRGRTSTVVAGTGSDRVLGHSAAFEQETW